MYETSWGVVEIKNGKKQAKAYEGDVFKKRIGGHHLVIHRTYIEKWGRTGISNTMKCPQDRINLKPLFEYDSRRPKVVRTHMEFNGQVIQFKSTEKFKGVYETRFKIKNKGGKYEHYRVLHGQDITGKYVRHKRVEKSRYNRISNGTN